MTDKNLETEEKVDQLYLRYDERLNCNKSDPLSK